MADPEIDAMGAVSEALSSLDEQQQARVIAWAAQRYGVKLPKGRGVGSDGASDASGGQREFEGFVDLLDAVNPKFDTDRALTGGYWLQVIQAAPAWPSQSVNNLLKDTGHGLSNVTASLAKAQQRKPALVRQVSKSGRAAQARKQYKLTDAGIAHVRALISRAPSESDGD